jgi:hypothetical protein
MSPLIKTVSALSLSLLLLASCSEDVDLIDGFKETAVVYGLLDQSENIHYFRINRAFIGPGNWLDIARIADSSYFEEVDATVTELLNGVETRIWKLRDTTLENKDTKGAFYAPKQKLYYFSTDAMTPLHTAATYKLHILLNNGKFEVEGETGLVSGITTSADAQYFRYSFSEDKSKYTQKSISITAGNTRIIQATLRVNFDEIHNGIDTVNRYFDWNLGESDAVPGGIESFNLLGIRFYELMRDNCVVSNPNVTNRRMRSIEVIATGGSEVLYDYMTINQPVSSLAQSKATYTNLKVSDGHRVVGIFSSRQTYRSVKYYINPINTSLRMIDEKSVIELCKGPITGSLFFCSQHPADKGESYACQ